MSTLPIESESGTFTGRPSHPHNGYWAGDFSAPTPAPVLTDWFAWGRARAASRTSSQQVLSAALKGQSREP